MIAFVPNVNATEGTVAGEYDRLTKSEGGSERDTFA